MDRHLATARAPSQAETNAAPNGLVAERFSVEGVEFVAFTWEPSPDVSSLTVAERAVLELVVRGASNAEIAKERRSAVRTVANQVAALLRKLGVSSRYEAMARFAGNGSP